MGQTTNSGTTFGKRQLTYDKTTAAKVPSLLGEPPKDTAYEVWASVFTYIFYGGDVSMTWKVILLKRNMIGTDDWNMYEIILLLKSRKYVTCIIDVLYICVFRKTMILYLNC